MKDRTLMTKIMALIILLSLITAEHALSQEQQISPVSPDAAPSPSVAKDIPYNTEQKLEILEYKLNAKTDSLEQRYEDFTKSATYFMSILSVFVAILTIFSIYRSLQQHNDYIKEKEFFINKAEEMQKYERDQARKMRERERPFEKSQLQNIEKLNSVISLVEKSFDLQHKREEAQSKLVEEMEHMKIVIEQVEKEAKDKYRDARELILSLEDVKAMSWPILTDEIRAIAKNARDKFEQVSSIVLREEEEQHPYELAKVYQLIGISAFYSKDIASAFKNMGEADRIYSAIPMRPDDTMSRAYTKHFLGVAAKNWRKKGDIDRGNVNEAYEYLSKAAKIVKDDPRQFLISVTLAEVLSYRSYEYKVAAEIADEIIQRFKSLEDSEKLDPNQRSLFVRILLIRGNLEMMSKRSNQAVSYYEKAFEKDSRNAYAHLSLLHAQGSNNSEKWKNALSSLESSGATKKQETITKVIALVWATIAAHESKDETSVERYLRDLESIGVTLSHIANRQPLFFSPISKNIEEFVVLKSQLSQYLKIDQVS